jgi:hypothetical protein
MKNGTEHDMTQGAVAVPLIGFTIPLVLGNFFQLFYNAADSIIVGRYVGERALAAVGTSTPVMNLVILLISGLCMGASILMSSQFGAGNYEQLSRQISTTLLSGCGFSIRADNLGVRTIASADTGTEGSDAGCACVSQDHFYRNFVYVYLQFSCQYTSGTGR